MVSGRARWCASRNCERVTSCWQMTPSRTNAICERIAFRWSWASRGGRARLTTLSIGFEEAAWDEGRCARLVAERCRTDHREVMLRSRDLFEGLPGFFAAMDEPTVDGANAYFISRAARAAGLTVVLSGAGGDEVFLGYGHFRRARLLGLARAALGLLPPAAHRTAVALLQQGGRWSGRRGHDRIAYLERPTAESAYLLFRGLFAPRQIAELLGAEQRELDALGSPWPGLGGSGAGGTLDAFVALDFGHYLQNQLLKDTDVMSMAHSVEVRVPFLDHPLVEHVLALPRAWRLERGRPKALLLDALGDALPQEVWDRPKMGFTFPFESWLRERADELERRCLEPKLLRPAAVGAVWRQFRAGRVHWSRPWSLLVLAQFGSR